MILYFGQIHPFHSGCNMLGLPSFRCFVPYGFHRMGSLTAASPEMVQQSGKGATVDG